MAAAALTHMFELRFFELGADLLVGLLSLLALLERAHTHATTEHGEGSEWSGSKAVGEARKRESDEAIELARGEQQAANEASTTGVRSHVCFNEAHVISTSSQARSEQAQIRPVQALVPPLGSFLQAAAAVA